MRILRNSTAVVFIFALIPLAVGIFVSSQALLDFLRPDEVTHSEELLLGTGLFKGSLILLGLLVLALSRLPIWDTSDAEDVGRQKPPSKRVSVSLAVILVISFFLRIYQLNAGLWLDEILTYINYARLPMGELVTTYSSENQHFLFSILARISFVVFGESGWALRLPAVFFGLGSLWALFLFARLVTDDREALLATALLAFSYHHLWFSQNARG